MTTWWVRSTEAQKLAQVDGAIDCGMTERECAMNLRVSIPDDIHAHTVVYAWAYRRGRRFNGKIAPHKTKRNAGNSHIVRNRGVFADNSHKDAYDIFERGPQSQNLFAAHPYDGEEFG